MSFDFHDGTALFGGSFHPPHLGHTQAIQGLLKNPGVKNVLILPSYGTPLKKVSVSPVQRMEMAKLAFADLPCTTISDFEFKNKIQFTWQLLSGLSNQIKKPIFVIGTDQFVKLDQWMNFPEVLGMCDWIVLLRKPTTLESLNKTIHNYVQMQVLKPSGDDREFITMGKRLKFVETDAIEVSSTLLREQIALGNWEQTKTHLAPAVKDYILRNQIYGK